MSSDTPHHHGHPTLSVVIDHSKEKPILLPDESSSAALMPPPPKEIGSSSELKVGFVEPSPLSSHSTSKVSFQDIDDDEIKTPPLLSNMSPTERLSYFS